MNTTAEKVSFTFGTEESTKLVRDRIAGAGDAGALWGTLNDTDAQTLRVATEDKPDLEGLFSVGGFRLDNEETAELFSALVEYAEDETSCDIDGVAHEGAGADGYGFCDCDMRNRAWSWAGDIADMVGVELI